MPSSSDLENSGKRSISSRSRSVNRRVSRARHRRKGLLEAHCVSTRTAAIRGAATLPIPEIGAKRGPRPPKTPDASVRICANARKTPRSRSSRRRFRHGNDRHQPAFGPHRRDRLSQDPPGRPVRGVTPRMPTPPASTAIHGIADADVANLGGFAELAGELASFLDGCDLAGYNIAGFDLPVLRVEFRGAGIEFDISNRRLVDR